MASKATWLKMAVAGVAMCVGGPALVYYVSPSEEEIFLRYNPELQRRSLENRKERQEDFDQFVTRLKQYSKSDKPMWEEEAARLREEAAEKKRADIRAAASTSEALKAEIRATASK